MKKRKIKISFKLFYIYFENRKRFTFKLIHINNCILFSIERFNKVFNFFVFGKRISNMKKLMKNIKVRRRYEIT